MKGLRFGFSGRVLHVRLSHVILPVLGLWCGLASAFGKPPSEYKFTVITNSYGLLDAFEEPTINEKGEVGFRGQKDLDQDVWIVCVGDGENVSELGSEGHGSNFTDLMIDNSGCICMRSTFVSSSSLEDDDIIYRKCPGGELQKVAGPIEHDAGRYLDPALRVGDAPVFLNLNFDDNDDYILKYVPDSDPAVLASSGANQHYSFQSSDGETTHLSINVTSELVYWARMTDSGGPQYLWRRDIPGVSLTKIVGTDETYGNITLRHIHPRRFAINDHGTVAFVARYGFSGAYFFGLFTANPGAPVLRWYSNILAPGGIWTGAFKLISFNNAGTIAYLHEKRSGETLLESAIATLNGGPPSVVVRKRNKLHDGNYLGTVDYLKTSEPFINNVGQICFVAVFESGAEAVMRADPMGATIDAPMPPTGGNGGMFSTYRWHMNKSGPKWVMEHGLGTVKVLNTGVPPQNSGSGSDGYQFQVTGESFTSILLPGASFPNRTVLGLRLYDFGQILGLTPDVLLNIEDYVPGGVPRFEIIDYAAISGAEPPLDGITVGVTFSGDSEMVMGVTGYATEDGADDCGSATPIGVGQYLGNLAGATADGAATCGSGQPDVWYSFTAPASGALRVTTCSTHDRLAPDAGPDTVLSLHTGCPGTTNNQVACNDDWPTGECPVCGDLDTGQRLDAAVTGQVSVGETVLIRVARNGTSGDTNFVLSVEMDSGDDAYEQNDSPTQAWNMLPESTWLSTQLGTGIPKDDDWYGVAGIALFGENQLVVTCAFTHAEGDIDIELYDSNGVKVAESTGYADNEVLTGRVHGTDHYHLRVYDYSPYAFKSNEYDLVWTIDGCLDDPHEENDNYVDSTDLTEAEGVWLSEAGGHGVAVSGDDDWYAMDLPEDAGTLVVTCLFEHAEGDVDLYLYHNPTEAPVAQSVGSGNSEGFRYALPSPPGMHFVRVELFGGSGCTRYDLKWSLVCTNDDGYEENDQLGDATWLTADAGSWLSTVAGPGIAGDDDWYEVEAGDDNNLLVVTCSFTHAEGNIDVQVTDWSGAVVAEGDSDTDNEALTAHVSGPGAYYLRVYAPSGSQCSAYDLWWDDAGCRDDTNEPNNAHSEATDLGAYAGTWLDEVDGLGVLQDEDWYRIEVEAPYERVVVTCTFSHAQGDIDLELLDGNTGTVATANGTADEEVIDVVVPAPGTYYVRVHPWLTANCSAYNLVWNGLESALAPFRGVLAVQAPPSAKIQLHLTQLKAGWTMSVERCLDLSAGSWDPVTTFVATSDETWFTDTVDPAWGVVYYRLNAVVP